jgi:hypothetical protein
MIPIKFPTGLRLPSLVMGVRLYAEVREGCMDERGVRPGLAVQARLRPALALGWKGD